MGGGGGDALSSGGKVKKKQKGVYFFCARPEEDGQFQRYETEEGLNVSTLKDGAYCLLCRSLQEVPSQGRGLAFMRLDSQQKWRLCILNKFDVDHDTISYFDLAHQQGKDAPTEMPKQLRTLKLSSDLSSGSLAFVNLHFHNVSSLNLKFDFPAKMSKDSGLLESTISPTRIFAMSDAEHFMKPKKFRHSKKRNRVDNQKWIQNTPSKSVITIFCLKGSTTGMDSIKKNRQYTDQKYLLVPSPFAKDPKWIVNRCFSVRERKHYLVPAQCLRALHNLSREDASLLLESYLEEYELSLTVTLMEVFSARPVRFSLVEEQEFLSLQQQKKLTRFEACGNGYLLSCNNDADCSLPGKLFLTIALTSIFTTFIDSNRCCISGAGTPVSWWGHDENLYEFPYPALLDAHRAVHLGFGDRRCSHCIGINVYLGRRSSHRPQPSPFVHSKGNIHDQDYQRKKWCMMRLLKIRLLMKRAMKSMETFSHSTNPIFRRFVGERTCQKRIFTCGLPAVTRVTGSSLLRPISFSNFPHRDLDYFHKDAIHNFKLKFGRFLSQLKQGQRSKCESVVSNIENCVGLGLPTTCAHLTYLKEKCMLIPDLHATFAMFDFAMPIRNKTLHKFFGWSFLHCTVVAYHLKNGKVMYLNDDAEDEVLVFAWGDNGSQMNTKQASSEMETCSNLGGKAHMANDMDRQHASTHSGRVHQRQAKRRRRSTQL